MGRFDHAVAFPELDDAQLALVAALGEERRLGPGHVLFATGDRNYDWVVLRSGRIEVVGIDEHGDERLVIAYGPRQFIGEVNLVTHQRTFATARIAEDSVVTVVPNAVFRESVLTDPRLSDVVLEAFIARRAKFAYTAADTLQILGTIQSPSCTSLLDFAIRNRLPHRWIEAGEPDGTERLAELGATPDDLPIAVTPYGILRRADPIRLGAMLGFGTDGELLGDFDVVVVGAGPSGLAASVYAASEGLRTLTVDAVSIGGQAGASTRIENYPGFPTGITGQELAMRVAIQAQKFGTRLTTPCAAVGVRAVDGGLEVDLHDGSVARCGAVVAASGASYRRLPVAGIERLEGAGVHYAATEMEARQHAGEQVLVVGGGNSAGQGAMFLAERCAEVHIVVRRPLAATMSAYLVDRIAAHPRITVHEGKEVVGVAGDGHLEEVTVRKDGMTWRLPCTGLFCFIGADPNSAWLNGVARDDAGFVLTDHLLDGDGPWGALGRTPLPFETTLPGVFAVGDVRSGSTKRVATAVGDGSAVVRSVHAHLASRSAAP
jgi:thioredoxin reductase (NADPH)